MKRAVQVVVVLALMASWAWAQETPALFSFGVEAENVSGYIDQTGKVVFQIPIGDEILNDFSEGFAFIGIGDHGYYIDAEGKKAFGREFRTGNEFKEGLALVKFMDRNEQGFIDRTGKVVIDGLVYPVAYSFSDGMAKVQGSNGKWGFIDRTGKLAIDTRLEAANFFTEGLCAISENGLIGFMDKSGAVVIPLKFREVGQFSEGLCPASLDKKLWGYIDKTGEWVIEPKFTVARHFIGGVAGACLNEEYSLIDKTGKNVLDTKFEDITEFSEGLADAGGGAENGHNSGYIDPTGKWVIPPRFESTLPFKNGLAKVQMNGRWGLIDKTGKFVWGPKGDMP